MMMESISTTAALHERNGILNISMITIEYNLDHIDITYTGYWDTLLEERINKTYIMTITTYVRDKYCAKRNEDVTKEKFEERWKIASKFLT